MNRGRNIDGNLRAGEARVRINRVAGQSTVTTAASTSPLRVLTPRARGSAVWAYLSNYGGGMLAGDETSLELEVGAAARCFLGTQASTKIYRNPKARRCSHSTTIQLEADSLLVSAPDPVQAFADSHYTQRQTVRMHPAASLILLDWCSAGRIARGERWSFARYQSRTELFRVNDGLAERIFLDALRLDPADGPLTTPERMGRFNCLANLVLVGPAVRELSRRLLTDIGARPLLRAAKLVSAASPMADGALLRLAGESLEEVGLEIRRHLAPIIDLIGGDPWARK